MHPKTARNPQGAGRPPLQLDWARVDELARLQLPVKQIAQALGVDDETLKEHALLEGYDLSRFCLEKAAESNANLLRQAEKHSKKWGPMTIFLLKNRLGYRDVVSSETTVTQIRRIEVVVLPGRDQDGLQAASLPALPAPDTGQVT